MRLIFAGTPEFAERALAALHEAGHSIALVLTRPDQPARRGQKLTASPVKTWALAHGLPVFQPPSLRSPEVQSELAAVGADLMVVAAYGLILPQAVLDLPRWGCLNIHASVLPRWRGAAPVSYTLVKLPTILRVFCLSGPSASSSKDIVALHKLLFELIFLCIMSIS